MIGRMWHGWTNSVNAAAYERHLQSHVLPALRRIPGHVGAQVFRRPEGNEIEFVTITFFESLDAVRRFAGENYANAVVAEEAQRLLSRFDRTCIHYEVAINSLAPA